MERAATQTTAPRSAQKLYEVLQALRAEVVVEGGELFERWRPSIRRSAFLPSAQNFAYYLALRRRDLRELQLDLMPRGLSSLGRCEARALENLDAVIAALGWLGCFSSAPPKPLSSAAYFRGHRLLEEHTEAALGPTPANRQVRIMVTLPSAAAVDYGLVRDLVERGMDVARINCAHDDRDAWIAMASHVRHAVDETGRSCRVCMDICGPRSRTGRVLVPHEQFRLQVGDRFLITVGAPRARRGFPVQVECSLPEAVEQVQPGHALWVDAGRLGAVVERTLQDGALLRVTHAGAKGVRLRPDKGLNFPDTELHLDPLTSKDLRDLDVIALIADMVGYSFVQRPQDIALLQGELAGRLDRPDSIAIVAKIETRLAIRNLPELIVQAAGVQPLAVMIARGDLAVEIGHQRLAEIQEELLWLCEAAHVPVIWATEVLDTFVHKGTSSRAEITDAAMAERAECVMLNKGRFAAEAVGLLDDLLGRMEGHQFKKTSRMRALRSW